MANTRDLLGDRETMEALIEDRLETFEDSDIAKLNSNAFWGKTALKSVNLPNLFSTSSSTFYDCYGLEEVSMPNIRTLGSSMFEYCYMLTSVNVDNLTSLNSYVFEQTGIGTVILPNITSIANGCFRYSRVGVVDIYKNVRFYTSTFEYARFLTHLILRSDTLCEITTTVSDLFNSSAILNGVGWIYVPSELVSTYKSATGWEELADQIVSIDEYPKQLQNETIDDSWEEIFASIDNGTYLNKYDIGHVKYVSIGGTPVAMEIVALDKDFVTAGGVAPITWLSRDILQTTYFNLPTPGGIVSTKTWIDSDIRRYLRNRIYPTIDPVVRNRILEVNKTYNVAGVTYSATETLWIPSYREIIGNTAYNYCEQSGVDYVTSFGSNERRLKRGGVYTSALANWYYLRTISSREPDNTLRVQYIASNGGNTNNISQGSGGLVIGFCT